MLAYSDLTIIKNDEGIPTALGYPINSILLQNNKPLFTSGGGKGAKHKDEDEEEEHDYNNLAIPAGLVCRTETICSRPEVIMTNFKEDEDDIIPDGLYEKLLALAESKNGPKKFTRRKAATKKPKAKSQKNRALVKK